MEHAHYGRMRDSRCLTSTAHLGCYADVLPQLDARCSGRKHCKVMYALEKSNHKSRCYTLWGNVTPAGCEVFWEETLDSLSHFETCFHRVWQNAR